MNDKFKRKDALFKIIAFQVLLLFVLPPLDGRMNGFRILIYVIFAVLSIITVLIFVKKYVLCRKLYFDEVFWGIVVFFAMCAVSAIWGLAHSIPISDVIRGILPFVWLVYAVILTQAMSRENIIELVGLIGVIAVVYALRIFYYYFIYVVGNPYERVTFHLVQATSIMPMIGSLLFGYLYIIEKSQKRICFIFSLMCYIATIMTATKSMLLTLVGGWILLIVLTLIFMAKVTKEKSPIIKNMLIIGCFMIVCTGILLGETNLGSRWKTMVKVEKDVENQGTSVVTLDEGSISVRIIELETAVECFKESPIFGKGIGYRWKAEGLDYGGPVIYMHNIIAFFMTDFGLIGIVYIFCILYWALKMLIKIWKDEDGFCDEKIDFLALLSIVGMAFAYANFFAVFRSIEYIVVCSIFVAALFLTYKVVMNGEKK